MLFPTPCNAATLGVGFPGVEAGEALVWGDGCRGAPVVRRMQGWSRGVAGFLVAATASPKH
uniref:Uncharacterized protein n=2 Tax=Ralstonia syzygii TaxID=28097 RepID=G3A248_9RALS|nr:conserved hypothetical protein [blood disease bacterium R229]CCA85480.1 conserved hypothetical protein [Ralstonia syzygii R24]